MGFGRKFLGGALEGGEAGALIVYVGGPGGKTGERLKWSKKVQKKVRDKFISLTLNTGLIFYIASIIKIKIFQRIKIMLASA